ncbi:MAG: hypothetical protein QM535_09585 [Limnohabitans sp.]|nr:hypothetical protein [Limnohabitans sp.]
MNNYKVIEIKDYDNLDEVAQRLGIQLSELIDFHNIYAKKEEFILSKEQCNIQSFYVYNWIFDKITDLSLKVPLGENYKLEHYPATNTLRYGVMYFIEEDVIKFELDLLFKKQNDSFVCYINRVTPVFINDVETDTIADEVAQLIGDNLYPLELLVDTYGNFLKVLNFEAIKQRWPQTKERIYKDYEGDWIDEKLNDAEINLMSENDFTNSLQNDLFLKSYFSGIYNCYFKEYSFERNIDFPLLENSTPVSYQVKYTINELWDEDNLIKITVNGVCNDERSLEEFDGGFVANDEASTAVEGDYKAHYFLEPVTHSIKSLGVNCDIALSMPVKVKVVVSLLGG